MKNVSEAKKLAYVEAISNGYRKTIATAVYLLLKDKPMTTEVLRDAGIPHQSLTASLSYLEDLGMIYKSELVQGRKRKFTLWKAVTDKEEMSIRKREIEDDKFNAWVKKGNDMGYFEMIKQS